MVNEAFVNQPAFQEPAQAVEDNCEINEQSGDQAHDCVNEFASDYEIEEQSDEELVLDDFVDSDYDHIAGDSLFNVQVGEHWNEVEISISPPHTHAPTDEIFNETLFLKQTPVHDPFDSDIGSSNTEYANSDGFETGCSEDENEDEPRNLKPDEFRDKTDMANPRFKIGQLFRDNIQLKATLQSYKIKHGYNLKIKPNERKRIRAKCQGGCSWHLFASYEERYGGLQVKTLVDIHTFPKTFSSRQVSSKWVAKMYLEKFRRQPNMKLSDIVSGIREDFHVEISKMKASRARSYAKKIVEGEIGEQYKRVRDYSLEITESNPGSTVEVLVQAPQQYFKRLYICLAGCKKGFLDGCRKMISLDSCHLRGDYPGLLMSAVGIDGNDGQEFVAAGDRETIALAGLGFDTVDTSQEFGS